MSDDGRPAGVVLSAHHWRSLRLRTAEVFTGVLCIGSQLLLNAQNLVVLGQSFASAWRSSLDLYTSGDNELSRCWQYINDMHTF